jgi:hypothetical protein
MQALDLASQDPGRLSTRGRPGARAVCSGPPARRPDRQPRPPPACGPGLSGAGMLPAGLRGVCCAAASPSGCSLVVGALDRLVVVTRAAPTAAWEVLPPTQVRRMVSANECGQRPAARRHAPASTITQPAGVHAACAASVAGAGRPAGQRHLPGLAPGRKLRGSWLRAWCAGPLVSPREAQPAPGLRADLCGFRHPFSEGRCLRGGDACEVW